MTKASYILALLAEGHFKENYIPGNSFYHIKILNWITSHHFYSIKVTKGEGYREIRRFCYLRNKTLPAILKVSEFRGLSVILHAPERHRTEKWWVSQSLFCCWEYSATKRVKCECKIDFWLRILFKGSNVLG